MMRSTPHAEATKLAWSKRIGLGLLALAIGLALLEAHAPRVQAAGESLPASPDRVPLEAELLARAESQGRVRVIVWLAQDFTPEGAFAWRPLAALQRGRIERARLALLDRLHGMQAELLRSPERLPLVALRVDGAALRALQADPGVARIQEDLPQPPILDKSVPLVGAPAAWSQGAVGAGQSIAILDSGVDADHPFLSGKVIGEACFSSTDAFYGSASLCPNGADSQIGPGAGDHCDLSIYGCAHGTHVAGIAAGSGADFSGVAPAAQLLSIQVFSRFQGEWCESFGLPSPCALTFLSDQIEALDQVAAWQGMFEIAAANMSLGSGEYTFPCDYDSRKPAIDNLRSLGIAVIVAAGNVGARDAIGSPACISSAISVGSTTKADAISSFSNIASFVSLLAPGSSIYSSVPGGGFATYDGTSMAAPHVAGAWAALASRFPAATVDEILLALRQTGLPVDDNRTGGAVQGLPRIRVDQALASLLPPEPTPTPTLVFEDVAYDHWAHDYITALYEAGYVQGCSETPSLYCPESILSRAESAVFMLRGKYGPIPGPPHPTLEDPSFEDVEPTFWAFDWIESLLAEDMTAGCNALPPLYCPGGQLTRAEAAVFFLRIQHGSDYFPPTPSGIFEDVDSAAWYADWAEAAYLEGLLPGCNQDPLRFCPSDLLDRAWAAYMMVQAKGGLPLPTPMPIP